MAKFNPGSLISEIRGSVGDDTYSKNAFGPYVKQKLTQTVRNTSFQQVIRQAFIDGNDAYKLLSDEEFKSWSEFVDQHLRSNGLSQRIRISAYNEFISRYVNRALLGSTATGFDAQPPCNQFSTITDLVASSGMLSATINTQNYDGTAVVAIYATEILSPTIRSINPSLYNFIGVLSLASGSDIVDLTQMYLDRYQAFGDGTVKRIGIMIKNIRDDNFAEGTKMYTNVLTDGTFPAEVSTEYQAILTYAGSQAFTVPSIPIQYQQNLFILAMQSLGVWALLDTFYNFFVDNNKDFTRINWKSPGNFTLTETGTVAFTPLSGMIGGTGNYWKTGWKPQTDGVNFTQNSGSAFCYVASQGVISRVDFGSRITAGSAVFISGFTGTGSGSSQGICNRSGAGLITTAWQAGLTMVTSSPPSFRTIRRNTSTASTVNQASLTPTNFEMYVCAMNDGGSPTLPSSNLIQMCGTGGNLDSKEISLKAVFDTYKTNIL